MKKIIAILFIVLLIFSTGKVYAFAMNTGFETDNMEYEDQQIFIKNDDLKLITEKPPTYSVLCFDVSEDGLIALGSESLDEKIISVYSKDVDFIYGYTFSCDGSYGIEWDGNNLIIYFVRSDVAAMFDEKGNCLELKKIPVTFKNNSYWNDYVFSKERTVGNSKYSLKNDMGPFNLFASSYSQVIMTASDGSINVIYDVNNDQLIKTIFVFTGVVLFIAVVLRRILIEFKRNYKL